MICKGIIVRTSPPEILRCIGRWVIIIIIWSKRPAGIARFCRSRTAAAGSENVGIKYAYEKKIIKITG